MSKHTPGPWILFQDQSVRHYAGIEAGKLSIVSIGYPDELNPIDDSGVHGNTEDEALANAYLIAAAPDLLEALENLENDDNSIPSHAWDMVQSAIAKAKGGQP